MAQSKTSRASVRAGNRSGGAVTFLGEIKFLIPLNGGRNAYVRNVVSGRMRNVPTDSDAFTAEVRSLTEAGHAGRLRTELERLASDHPGEGWDVTAKRLEEAGALTTAAAE